MANFLSPEEAAKRLGITTDELTLLRERREIFGVRDGAGWKYREDEIQRYLEQRAENLPDQQPEAEESALQLGEPSAEGGSDSVLLSEEALGQSGLGSSPSTVIGAQAAEASNPESDLELDREPSVLNEPGGSDVTLVPSAEGGSDVTLVPTPSPGAQQSSDLALADLDDLGQTPGAEGEAAASEPAKSKSAETAPESGKSAEADEDLPSFLMEDSSAQQGGGEQATQAGAETTESDLSLTFSPESQEIPAPVPEQKTTESDLSLTFSPESQETAAPSAPAGDSALEFGASDLVLGESAAGASDPLLAGSAGVVTPQPTGGVEEFDEDDLVLGEGTPATPGLSDSGISLGTADDSGLSLEEPLDLDAEELVPSDSSGEVEDLPSEDEFNLTPALELDDQDTESGSQVIALDDEPFDAESQTVLSQQPQPEAAVAPVPMVAAPPEAPFSGWTVTGLALLFIFLAITGMMMFDMVMHMWSWDGPYTYNSALMDLILGLFEG